MRRILSLISLLTVSSVATAGQWSQEPSTIFGLQIGKPLLEVVPECPSEMRPHVDMTAIRNFGKPCVTIQPVGLLPTLYTLENMSEDAPGFAPIYAKVTPQNTFEGVQGEFSHFRYEEIKAALIARYGKPTVTKTEVFQTRAGATFNGEAVRWDGREVHILLDEYASTMRDGSFSVMTNTFFRERAKQTQAAGLKLKDKF